MSVASLKASNNDLWRQWTPKIGGFNAGEIIRTPERPENAPIVGFTNIELSVQSSVGKNADNQKIDVIAVLAHLRRVGILADEVFQEEMNAVSQHGVDGIPEKLIPNVILGIIKFQKEVLKWRSYDDNIYGSNSITTDFSR